MNGHDHSMSNVTETWFNSGSDDKSLTVELAYA
jgi:hypothetical protein